MLRSGSKLQVFMVFMWKLWHKDEGIHVFTSSFLSEMMTLTTATEMSSLLSLEVNMTLSLNQEISISFSLVMNRSSAVVTVLDLSAHFARWIQASESVAEVEVGYMFATWSHTLCDAPHESSELVSLRLNVRVKWSHNRFFFSQLFLSTLCSVQICIHSRNKFHANSNQLANMPATCQTLWFFIGTNNKLSDVWRRLLLCKSIYSESWSCCGFEKREKNFDRLFRLSCVWPRPSFISRQHSYTVFYSIKSNARRLAMSRRKREKKFNAKLTDQKKHG